MGNVRITNDASQAIVQLGASHTQRTVSSSAVLLLNHTLHANTTHILVQFNNANCRVTFDGTTPVTGATTGTGFRYMDGASAYWTPKMLAGAKGIREASTDVILEIQELNSI